MKRPRVNEDVRPMLEVRTGMASFLTQIHDTKRPFIIAQQGNGVAVLLDAGEIGAGHGVGHQATRTNVMNKIRR